MLTLTRFEKGLDNHDKGSQQPPEEQCTITGHVMMSQRYAISHLQLCHLSQLVYCTLLVKTNHTAKKTYTGEVKSNKLWNYKVDNTFGYFLVPFLWTLKTSLGIINIKTHSLSFLFTTARLNLKFHRILMSKCLMTASAYVYVLCLDPAPFLFFCQLLSNAQLSSQGTCLEAKMVVFIMWKAN